jgi:hypothetical protein
MENPVETFAQFVELNRRVDDHRGYYAEWLERHNFVCRPDKTCSVASVPPRGGNLHMQGLSK